MRVTCYSCGAENEFPGPVGRRDKCVGCGVDLRCCLQCKVYDPDRTPECQEQSAELQRDRAQGNFCEFYMPGPGRKKLDRDAESAKAAFEALFSNKK
ncbi:MAG: hypothetical protein QM765_13300 [Myxococcales bacterium]